ncbi:MAG: hypothetical protein HOK41_15210 [Nitrospina sp.]|jgi:spore coat polysaccharide biosynthesis predicted glycosyltransferase SpsG|nr:hypothetical protein [Nitrospina sp.]MBT6716737.1 hypothetical protein [Nitrospina sp.]
MPQVNIFCQASFTLGMGHLARQIHIAKELRKHNADTTFFVPEYSTAIEALKQHNLSYSIIEGFDSALKVETRKADVTILDIKDTSLPFIDDLKIQTKKIVSFEDQGEGRNHVDILIDCNLNLADAKKVSKSVKTLFGLPYAVLASEFENFNLEKRNFPERIQTLLITFGGTDPHNITLDLLKHIPNSFKTTIIVGAGFQNQNAFQELDKNHIRILKNVQDMAQALANHDAVFCSGGVTLHEAMCVGTPAFVISQVEHQEDKAKAAETAGAAINLGRANSWGSHRLDEILALNKESLQAMSDSGKKSIDGKGLKRVVENIL